MTNADFTCLIPAFNEADRIGQVLEAVVAHRWIERVIVIDDGSSDGTADIARNAGATVISTGGNRGKSRALLEGLLAVRTSHVVLIDADLAGLDGPALTALIAPVRDGWADASISLRGNAPGLWRLIGIDYISGERVIPNRLFAGSEKEIAQLPRFGFEVFLNELLIATESSIAIVRWPRVASPSKAAKRGLVAGVLADVSMIRDIFRTIGLVECLSQIMMLRRLMRTERQTEPDALPRRSARPPFR